MSRLTVGILVLILAGCGSSESSEPVVNNERTVGDPAVIARIQNSTSCVKLHREFQIAAGNASQILKNGGDASVPLSYQSEANLRMQEVGCYG